MSSSSEYFMGLQVHSLQEVLKQVPLPPSLSATSVSSKWRCVLAPQLKEECTQDRERLLGYMDAGIPVLYTPAASSSASTTSMLPEGVATGVEFVTDRRRSRLSSPMEQEEERGLFDHCFRKPQIAVKDGWGSPGTIRDHSTYHVLVRSFRHVFEPHSRGVLEGDAEVQAAMNTKEIEEAEAKEEEEQNNTDSKGLHRNHSSASNTMKQTAPLTEDAILELQLFHRNEEEVPDQKLHSLYSLQCLASSCLCWPETLETHKVLCDEATVAVQKGFRRWWDINDCGEFVLEGALPALPIQVMGSSSSSNLATKLYSTISSGDKSSAPVKLCLYGTRGSYDWFIHDDASLTNNTAVVSLDIFGTPDEALPKDPSLLPILVVCVLEGGGPLLLTPPNLPVMQLVLQDAVMIEQRAISYLWLDEVSYFLHRCRLWSSNPLIYPFVEVDLQDKTYIPNVLIPLLYELFHRCHNNTDSGEAVQMSILKRRMVASLYAIGTQTAHYGLEESSRRSLLSTLTSDNGDMVAVLQGPLSYAPLIGRQGGRGGSSWSVKEMLDWYWDTRQFWPKEGCVLRVPTFYPEGRVQGGGFLYVPVVYPPSISSPVFGCEEAGEAEATLKEYVSLKRMENKPRELYAYLATQKNPADDLLDELF